MLVSLSLLLLFGLLFGKLADKISIPPLVGMLLAGICLGPSLLNWLTPDFLALAPEMRQIALVIILTRAGLGLNIKQLKQVGATAVMMAFMPALIEITAVTLLAPIVLGIAWQEGLLLGSIMAAISPAVVVPRMLHIQEEGYGTKQRIPQMILASASVDDVIVLTLFSAFLQLNQGGAFSAMTVIKIPIAIILGIGCGFFLGKGFTLFFERFNLSTIIKTILLLSCAFLILGFEEQVNGYFSGMLAIMTLATTLHNLRPQKTKELANSFSQLWVVAEILLFGIVGASLNLSFVWQSGLMPVLFILLISLIRMLGVYLCLLQSPFTTKERLFCTVAYLPKATVQAAIGGIPLAVGLANGQLMLTVAVLTILITAPIGALAIDHSYQKLLKK